MNLRATSAEQPRTSRKTTLSRPFTPLHCSTYKISLLSGGTAMPRYSRLKLQLQGIQVNSADADKKASERERERDMIEYLRKLRFSLPLSLHPSPCTAVFPRFPPGAVPHFVPLLILPFCPYRSLNWLKPARPIVLAHPITGSELGRCHGPKLDVNVCDKLYVLFNLLLL